MKNKTGEVFSITRDVGNIFLSGIGGIGMSAIAEILQKLGCQVQGSDQARNANVERLEELGIKVFVGQKAGNVNDAAIIVRSSAIKIDNPELIAADSLKIPIFSRAEILAEIMKLKKCVTIAGSHGKTTTTSIMASLFDKVIPGTTVVNGGILNSCNSNAYFGEGEWLIAEADESDGSFLLLPAQVAIVTNIDPEHLDHYGSFSKLKESFKDFVQKVPRDGLVIYCFDREELYEIVEGVSDKILLSYGFNKGANVRAVNLRTKEIGYIFDVEFNFAGRQGVIADVELPMFGSHNVLNALATISTGIGLDFPEEQIKESIGEFLGVKRRLTVTGVVNDVVVIDDYGHHPEEIKASVQAVIEMRNARARKGKVIAVLQPHRYSRVESLFAEFAACLEGADLAFLGDIFAAGEDPIPGISKENLLDTMQKNGQDNVHLVEDWSELDQSLKNHLEKGDIVICMGAGNITKYANELPSKLSKII